jgi:signal transduction histidine kinase
MSERPIPSALPDLHTGAAFDNVGAVTAPSEALREASGVGSAAEVASLIDQVAHDLRSALNGIQSWAYVLDHSMDAAPPPAQRAMAGLRTAMQQQLVLIEHMEESVRLLADEAPPLWQATDLRAAVNAAIEGVRPATEPRRIALPEVIVDGADGDDGKAGATDPADTADTIIQGDPRRLEPLLRHLLLHCLKQARNGDTIMVKLSPTTDEVKLRITESHVSAKRADERVATLTDFFGRRASPGGRTPPRQSSGLLLTRRMVEMLGGRLLAEHEGDCSMDVAKVCIAVVFPRAPQPA